MYRVLQDEVEIAPALPLRNRADVVRMVDTLFQEDPSKPVRAVTRKAGIEVYAKLVGDSPRVRPRQKSIDLRELPFKVSAIPGHTAAYARIRTKAVVFRANDPEADPRYLVATADGVVRPAYDTPETTKILDQLEQDRMNRKYGRRAAAAA